MSQAKNPKKTLKFEDHYTEEFPYFLLKNKKLIQEHKVLLWNHFIDSGLSDITADDTAILPRVLPMSYFKTIESRCRGITEFVLKLMSLPESDVKEIFPQGPNRDHLLQDLKILKYRPRRFVGSFRFDMAIVGEPKENNPPQLLEINEIGFDGLARMPFIQDSLFNLIPKLNKNYFGFNTSKSEIKNMNRLAHSLARFQTDCYNWDEECLLKRADELKYDMKLLSPNEFKFLIDPTDFPHLIQARVLRMNSKGLLFSNGWHAKSYMVSFALDPEDFKKHGDFFAKLIRNQVPQYGPFISGLVASKSILALLSDGHLRKKLLGTKRASLLSSSILQANLLPEIKDRVGGKNFEYVLKHVDGYGGDQVYFGDEILKQLKKIKKTEEHHWVAQQRTKLNVLEIEGILSRPKRTICDLGVFIQYDWSGDKFNHFEVGGFLSRATNKSFKVNVSSGGAQMAVLFDRRK